MPVAAPAKLASLVLLALLNVAIRTPVVDPAGALSPSQQQAIELRVRALRQHTGVQLAVLTILSTEGEPIADFSHRTAVAWGGGRKGYDDGLLLTVAVTDRRIRLEVGYGLEAQLPDAVVRSMLEAAREPLHQKKFAAAIGKILDQLELRLVPGSAVTASPLQNSGPAATADGGAATALDPSPAEFPEPPRPVRAAEPPVPPLSPLAMLALVPLIGVLLGYALGAWRCSQGLRAVDAFAYLTLGAIAFVALLIGADSPYGHYLAIALAAIGWASMFARVTGLTLAGHLVAVVLAGIPALMILLLMVLLGGPNPKTESNGQHYLLLVELVGAGTLTLVAVIIKHYFAHTFLWEESRTRAAARSFGGGRHNDDSGGWYVDRDNGDGGRGGGGGGGGDWNGGGGNFGGGGASMEF